MCAGKNKKAVSSFLTVFTTCLIRSRLENLSQFIARLATKIKASERRRISTKSINHLLDDIHGKKEENLIETVSIRAHAES